MVEDHFCFFGSSSVWYVFMESLEKISQTTTFLESFEWVGICEVGRLSVCQNREYYERSDETSTRPMNMNKYAIFRR